MNPSYDNPAAVVVLPAVGGGRLANPRLRQWLARTELERRPFLHPLLMNMLAELGTTSLFDGLAALRLWGQTGNRPTNWIAAADPVSLEPRLGGLRLHAVAESVTEAELQMLMAYLQDTLADDGISFAAIGDCAYLTSGKALMTSPAPAAALDGDSLEFLPGGLAEAATRRAVSEIEMALHACPVNAERDAAGLRPVNSLWLWGGGLAPPAVSESLPPLFGDDALARGYWLSRSGTARPWPGSIGACLAASTAGFVAMVPAKDDARLLESSLAELRAALRSGRLERLVLCFRDGVHADVRRAHALRLWRMRSPLLDRGADRA